MSTSQGARPQRKPALPTPCPWISSLQNCERMNFGCLNHTRLTANNAAGPVLQTKLQRTLTSGSQGSLGETQSSAAGISVTKASTGSWGRSWGGRAPQPGEGHPVWAPLVVSLREAPVTVPTSKVLLLISYQITGNLMLFISHFISF